MKHIFLAILSLVTTALCWTQETGKPVQSIRFKHLSIQDGLSQNTVFEILQDKYGFIWLATNDGLNRYDGYEFKHFKHDINNPHSLSDSWVASIVEDSKGQLWAGTFNSGVNRIRPDRESFERIPLGIATASGLSQSLIPALIEKEPGYIWAALDGHGIVEINDKTLETRHYQSNLDPKSLPSNKILEIYKDPDGIIWIGSDRGLSRYNPDSDGFETFNISNEEVTVKRIRVCNHGDLWIGTDKGIFKAPKKALNFEKFLLAGEDLDTQDLLFDRNDQLWIATNRQGLIKYSDQGFAQFMPDPFLRDSISDNIIESLYQDHSGMIWVGTYGNGISTFNQQLQGFHHQIHHPMSNSLAHDSLAGMIELEDGRLLIATRQKGLDILDRKTQTFRNINKESHPKGMTSDTLRHVFQTKDKNVWVAGEGGLSRLSIETGEAVNYTLGWELGQIKGSVVHYLFEDSKERFWQATYEGGASLMDRENETFQAFLVQPGNPQSISSNYVNLFYEDSHNRLWIATEFGLNQFIEEGQHFQRYLNNPTDPKSLGHNSVMSIMEHSQYPETLWIGTYGGGVNRFDPASGTFKRLTTRQGLANDSVYGILEDAHGDLWISTNGGISQYNIQENHFRTYDTNNGLIHNEYNRNSFLRTKDDYLYFGGTGLTSFRPDHLKSNAYVPQIIVTSITKGNAPLALDKAPSDISELIIDHGENVFTVSFAAMDFNAPQRNKFAYFLDGFESDWIDLNKQHQVTYTNLDVGSYTLRIKGTNNNGIWNNEGATLKVIVNPPWWHSKAAYLSYAAILMFLLFIIIRDRRREGRRELQRAVSLGKAEFATTVLHNIGNVLNSVKVANEKNTITLRSSKIRQLTRALEMLLKNMDNAEEYLKTDPRGKLLPNYFKNASAIVLEEFEEMTTESEEMAEQLALMKDIIETQQAHASISLLDEAHNLNQIIKDALKVQESGLKNRKINVQMDLQPLPPVKLPKTQLMHIIINLIKNAREAMESASMVEKKLFLETGRHSGTEVYLKVRDTGMGISPENRQKVFQYGFTTKRSGHGFGLNYCSRAMKEMGGTIDVDSPGIGQGATFTLIFKVDEED